KLLQLRVDLWLRILIEVVARIESITPEEAVRRAVDGVRSGFQTDVRRAAGSPTVFRFSVELLIELLNRVDGQNSCRIPSECQTVHHRLAVEGRHAVETLDEIFVTVFRPQSIRRCRSCAAAVVAERENHARPHFQKKSEVAAVERQIIDRLIAE